jgi:hypothetical protein
MNFNLNDHIKFINDVKENPDLYKPVGEQIYCSPNGMSDWININKVCPNCGSFNGFYKVIGNRPEKGWNECSDCGWIGGEYETLTHESYINQKRFKNLSIVLEC